MNYKGFEIKPDFTIWKDGKQRFSGIPCYSVRDAELLIDSHIMAHVFDQLINLPNLSSYDLKSILNEV